MWYGVDESSCYGIVTQKKLAKQWEARSDDNSAVEFKLNELPPIERWRNSKMFPHAPRTGPSTNIGEHMEDYYAHVMLNELLLPNCNFLKSS